MSFIVQIFSLLYSYRYIVTLRSVDCDGDYLCVAVSLLYFLIFLLNKCEHAESINMCVCLYIIRHRVIPFPRPTPCHLMLHSHDCISFVLSQDAAKLKI